MGRATEELAEHLGHGVGGLLNATFGNAAELIIALMALSKGLTGVVKASITRLDHRVSPSHGYGIAVCTDDSRLGSKPARMTSSSPILGKRGGGRILVVDDEPGILQYLRRVLEHATTRS